MMKKKRLFKRKKIYYSGPESDHFDGKRFFNPWNPQVPSFYKVMYWKITSKRKRWPKKIENSHSDTPPQRVEGNQLRISFVGHSTMLIQTQGLNIITDPIWSHRASPFKYFGPARYTAPGTPFERLPPIDLILVSHNHYDHLDIPTLQKIWEKDHPKIITPLGNDSVIQLKCPSIQIKTLDWYETIEINQNVRIHLAPSQHWSARGFSDKNRALWGAFIISTPDGNIYFCGDSGYGDGSFFREAHKKFGPFRFAMLPIGAYEPRWFTKYSHMNPEDAVLAHKDLGEPYTTAIHFETFRLTNEGFSDPSMLLAEACKKFSVSQERFRVLKSGEAWWVPSTQKITE